MGVVKTGHAVVLKTARAKAIRKKWMATAGAQRPDYDGDDFGTVVTVCHGEAKVRYSRGEETRLVQVPVAMLTHYCPPEDPKLHVVANALADEAAGEAGQRPTRRSACFLPLHPNKQQTGTRSVQRVWSR